MQVQRVNILHISDLHYSQERQDDHRVINHAFLSDLKKLSATELKPHLVVFSGDFVRSGDDNASYYDAMSDVIEPLLQIIGLDESRLFLAPGNHDVQRSVIQASEVVQQGLETTLTNRDKLNDFYIKNRHYEYIRQKLGNYLEFRDLLSNKHLVEADLFVEVYYVRDLNVAIVIVNTAWMSRGGLSEKDDRQRILVPEISLRRALGKLPDTKARILIGHHPHDWLASMHRTTIVGSLRESSRFICMAICTNRCLRTCGVRWEARWCTRAARSTLGVNAIMAMASSRSVPSTDIFKSI